MKKGLCIFLSFLRIFPAHSKDLGVHGTVFPIEEESLLTLIQNRLTALQEDGKLEEMKNKVRDKMVAGVQSPLAVKNIMTTQEPRSFLYDPTLMIGEDIKDHGGKLIVKAGTKVNPLDYVNWGKPMLFIMGDQESHVSLLTQYPAAQVVLVSGKPLELETRLHRPIYFDQAGKLVEKFGIQQVPCLITQQNKHLLITEFKAEGDKK